MGVNMRARLACTIVATAFLLALVPDAARADVIPPGAKPVQYCFEITNLAAFPDYVIVAALVPTGHRAVTGGCTDPIRGAKIYALKRADYDPAAIPQDFQAQQTFFASSPKVIRPGVQVSAQRTVEQGDRRTAIVDVLTIATLTDATFDLRFVSVRYTFSDGTTQELPYQQQGVRPNPNDAPVAPSSGTTASPGGAIQPPVVPGATIAERSLSLAWFALLPLAALIAIVVVVLLRRRA